MSATHPIQSQPAQSQQAAGSDQRPYEPSMEEILASIRRIIADDQSLPGRLGPRDSAGLATDAPEPQVAAVHRLRELPPEPPVVEPPVVAPPELPVEPKLDPRAETMRVESMRVESMMEPHGAIAAPQFASPEGPRSLAERPWRAGESRHGAAEPVASEDDGPDLLDDRLGTEDDPAASDLAGHASAGDEVRLEPPAESAAVSASRGATPVTSLFSASTDQSVASAFNVLAATRLADNSDELLTLARDMIRPLLQTWLDDNLPSMVERMVRAEIERVARAAVEPTRGATAAALTSRDGVGL